MRAHKKPTKLQKLFRICKFWHYFFPDICYFVHSCNQFAAKSSLSFVSIRLTYSRPSVPPIRLTRSAHPFRLSVPFDRSILDPFPTHFRPVSTPFSIPYRTLIV